MKRKDQYLELLEAMKKTKDEMRDDSPKISFNFGRSLEEQIELARNSNSGIPNVHFIGLNIGGADVRIYGMYGYEKMLKLYLNIGCVSTHQAFYNALIEKIKFPLIIEDNCGYSKKVNLNP